MESSLKRMIFHHPLPLNPNATSASEIRPIKMLEAFKNLGYEVVEVTGYGNERKNKIQNIKKRIIDGEIFDFIYSESSTQPTLLTEKNHLPIYPFLDFGFFSFCRKNGIKIGLFYRDIYWAFPEYGKELSLVKKNTAKLFYWYDLYKYHDLVDILYLPSLKMAYYIPLIDKKKCKALPPGHDVYEIHPPIKNSNDRIELLYIGGIGSHYQMHELFTVLSQMPNIYLTICTRESEWDKVRKEYLLSENIAIVHKKGSELDALYRKADIAMLFVKPQEYREFAAPVKLFEYIGQEKPVIATKGTLAGEFVAQNDIGWSLEYNEQELKKVLSEIIDNRSCIIEKKDNIIQMKPKHLWNARAMHVAKELG